MEFLDILDEFGNMTEMIKSKDIAHIEGLFHAVVSVFIFNSK
mgnify:CR=1 FL=1